MLKIERDHSIQFYYRESLFTRSFLKALGLAICLHLCGWIFFEIQPLIVGESTWVFPPVEVQAHTASLEKGAAPGVVAYLDKEAAFPKQAAFPPISKPRLPEILPIADKNSAASETMFTVLEKMDYEFSLESPVVGALFSMQIHLFGPLARAVLLADNEEIKKQKLNVKEDCLKRYSVQIDNKTGAVIWFSSDSENLEEIDQLCEKKLSRMHFAPRNEGFITAGEIEFSFIKEKL